MRLRRLDLTRYGKFTDASIDFGERVEGVADLHIVYGPNEAGKSTALAAFLDLLFGIEMQSRYGFMHPYSTMQVGGCLELSVGRRELVRVKRRAASLMDAGGAPVPEGLILGDLGGLDRTAYRTMFSLDDDTLEAGGKSILASNGELGQLLFAASAGLSELGSTLNDIRQEAENFARPHARAGELQGLKAELVALKQQREAIDTLAAEYNRLAASRDSTRAQYDAARGEQARARAALARVVRLAAALPRLAALDDVQRRLVPLAGLPDAPAGWLAQLEGLDQAEAAHRSAVERAAAELDRLRDAAAVIEVDAAALGLTGELAALAELRARDVTAALDLPKLRRRLAHGDGTIAGLLRQLGRADAADPSGLLLTPAQAAAFDELIVSRSGIDAAMTAAVDEHAASVQQLTQARQDLVAEAGGAPDGALQRVSAALGSVRQSDHAARLGSAATARAGHAAAVAARLARLAPWAGSVEGLAGLALPGVGTVHAWQRAADRDEAVCESAGVELAQVELEVRRREAELEAIGQTAGLLSDEAAAEIRRAREAAWAEHRARLDSASADAFEMILRRDDIVATARLGHERDLARLHQAGQELAVRRVDAAEARVKRDRALAERQRRGEAMLRECAGLGGDVAAVLSPAWLLGWLASRDKVLESRAAMLEAEQELGTAAAEADRLHGALAEALARAGLGVEAGVSLAELVELAAGAVAQGERLTELRKAVASAERTIGRRELALQKEATEDRRWRDAWAAACGSCWLGAAAAGLPIAAVREMLASAALLGPAHQAQADLAERIRGMEEDQSALAATLARIAAVLGMASDQGSLGVLADGIARRIEQAMRAEEERLGLVRAIGEAEEGLRRVRDEAGVHARRVGEMTAFMQAGSLIELAGKLRDAELKAELEGQAARGGLEIQAGLGAGSLEEARAMLAGVRAEALEQEQTQLATQLDGLETSTRELFAASRTAMERIDAVGGDDAVARIEEKRRTAVLDIEDKAQRHLRLRLGIAAADRALRVYRDQHRSSMMVEASEAFRIISRGAYSGLGTRPDRDGDMLVAQGADGMSKLATDLSKGTRFQLYLALRAAGYREFAKQRRPVPFIADDVMETFDDPRAEETLRILDGMAGLGQVIYLTHHQHLLPMAERVVPGARIHVLADPPGLALGTATDRCAGGSGGGC